METNKKVRDPSWRWTNERHVHFLNSMESSFVRTMLESNGRLPRLDRYLPDSSDSTQDLKTERRRRYSTSDILDRRVMTEEKTRTLLSQPYISSQDQVVPQLENRRGVKDEEEDQPSVRITPVAPSN